jgi:hypothetical protein
VGTKPGAGFVRGPGRACHFEDTQAPPPEPPSPAPRVAQKTRTRLQVPHLDPRAPDSESRPGSRLAGVGSLLPVSVRTSGPGPGTQRRVCAPAQRLRVRLAAPASGCAPGRSCCWSLAASGRRRVLKSQEAHLGALSGSLAALERLDLGRGGLRRGLPARLVQGSSFAPTAESRI